MELLQPTAEFDKHANGTHVLLFVRDVVTTAVVWVVVGVPVAALLSLIGIFLLFAGREPAMLITGAVLGVVHGLWLTIGGRVPSANTSESSWPGALSGALLGLLGFPAVYSHSESATDIRVVALYVAAALAGGMVAGVVSLRAIAAYRPSRARTPVRSIVTGCVLLSALTLADYQLYWTRTVEKLPALPLSHAAVTGIAPGNMRGSQWSGCYHYEEHEVPSPIPTYGNTGLLVIAQNDGILTGGDFGAQTLRGAVDRDGHFRLGGDLPPRIANSAGGMRILWKGRLSGDTVIFTRRTTFVGARSMTFSRKSRGTAQRIRCPDDRPALEKPALP